MLSRLVRFTSIIITLLTLNSQALISQFQEKKFVINRFGTPFMSEPNIQSDTLSLIKPGVEVMVNPISIQIDSLMYPSNEITLTGNWLRTELNGEFGYVFSADLSGNQPLVKLKENNLEKAIYSVDILGQMIDSTATIHKVEYSEANFVDYQVNYYTYQYGKGEDSWFDGCWYQKFYLEGWNLNKAFHVIRNKLTGHTLDHKKGFYANTPILQSIKGFTYQFEMSFSAMRDIIIRYDNDKNLTVISFNSCT